jgi:hypothetical protein
MQALCRFSTGNFRARLSRTFQEAAEKLMMGRVAATLGRHKSNDGSTEMAG